MLTAYPGDGEGRPGICQMKEGGYVKPAVAVRQVEFCDGSQGMAFHILVGQHNALGATCCAARIVEVSHIIVLNSALGRG